jgi:hypothetical protein
MKRRSFFASLFGVSAVASIPKKKEPEEQIFIGLGGGEVIKSDDPRVKKVIDDLYKEDPWQQPFDGKRKKEVSLGVKGKK